MRCAATRYIIQSRLGSAAVTLTNFDLSDALFFFSSLHLFSLGKNHLYNPIYNIQRENSINQPTACSPL